MVVLEQAAESLLALNLARWQLHDWLWPDIVRGCDRKGYVAPARMWAFEMMLNEFLDDVTQVILAQDQEVIEALGAWRPNPAFCVSVHVWCEWADALRIIDRGDMASADLKGDWAGEIGQTQFLPSSYVKYAVDFESKGHRDLVRSTPDVLASTANYLKSHGWQRGQGWGPGQSNFVVIQEWNKAEVYAKTIALFADKLDGGRTGKRADR